jgi:putative transposase
MARTSEASTLADRLTTLIPESRVLELAKELGVVERIRKVDIYVLVWSLILGFQTGTARTLTGLLHLYNKRRPAEDIVRSSFHDRLTEDLARLLRALALECLEALRVNAGVPGGYLDGFEALLAVDATVLRLRSLLASSYPACRTNHTQAAAKLHVVMNVVDASVNTVRVTGEKVHDQTPWRRLGRWVEGCLLLLDLGYYSFQLFDRIDQNGGFYLSRLKSNANLLILKANRVWRGNSIPVEGRWLKEILGSLKREVLDVQVQVRFMRRTYRGRRSQGTGTARLIAVRDEVSGRYHCYLTNVPAERLAAEDISQTYALRWQVELLFKAMKSHGHLAQLPSAKKGAVDSLIWASILATLASQTLFRLIRKQVGAGRFVPLLRWAALYSRIAEDLLRLVLVPDPVADEHLHQLLLREAPDPNLRRRDRALRRVGTRDVV